MKLKIRNLLFELSRNSRISTKDLGKKLHTSQQSASYLINSLEKKKVIKGYTTIVDPAKLGFVNVLVGFNFKDFDFKKEVLDSLLNEPSVIRIEEARYGVDLIAEFCAKNLSAFNKQLTEFQKNKVFTRFVLPVIVKHKFQKNYLARKSVSEDTILCGDRPILELSTNEDLLLKELIKNPVINTNLLASKINVSIKTAVVIRKRLINMRIINGFSSIFDYEKLGIRRYHLLLQLHSNVKKLVEFAKVNKFITSLTKIIGEYNILLTVEDPNDKDILRDLRKLFNINKYLWIETSNIKKYSYLPV